MQEAYKPMRSQFVTSNRQQSRVSLRRIIEGLG